MTPGTKLDLPLTTKERTNLVVDNEGKHPGKEADQGCVQIDFNPAEQKERAGKTKPRIGLVEELRLYFLHYIKKEKPELLKCEVEEVLKAEGFRILWTPPYCPKLQSIERFWAAGKNHAGFMYIKGQTTKETIKDLRDGW